MVFTLFQDNPFSYFGFYDSIELGLYMVIVGYYFLIFAYFSIMRFRLSKKPYWLFFSLLFIALAASRVFFIIHDFYVPELNNPSVSDDEFVVSLLMLTYRLATFSTWMATTCLMGMLGILLFPPDTKFEKKPVPKSDNKILNFLYMNKRYVKYGLRILLMLLPVIISILAFTLPDGLLIEKSVKDNYTTSITPVMINIAGWEYPIGRFVFNFVFQPLFIAIIPFIFLYLAWKTFGVLRRSYLLNGIGFLIYYIGRIARGVFEVIGWPNVQSFAPPLLILLSLLLIVIANSFEALK